MQRPDQPEAGAREGLEVQCDEQPPGSPSRGQRSETRSVASKERLTRTHGLGYIGVVGLRLYLNRSTWVGWTNFPIYGMFVRRRGPHYQKKKSGMNRC